LAPIDRELNNPEQHRDEQYGEPEAEGDDRGAVHFFRLGYAGFASDFFGRPRLVRFRSSASGIWNAEQSTPSATARAITVSHDGVRRPNSS
jgi:hypothetical protein